MPKLCVDFRDYEHTCRNCKWSHPAGCGCLYPGGWAYDTEFRRCVTFAFSAAALERIKQNEQN